MIDKTHIENVLRANGISSTAKDEEIRSVLLSARYKKDEVDAAVLVLRENTKTKQTRVDGLHKVFRSDETLSSSEIATLLGIDVNLEERIPAGSKAKIISGVAQSILFFISIFLAITAAVVYMYIMQIGVFYPHSAVAVEQLE